MRLFYLLIPMIILGGCKSQMSSSSNTTAMNEKNQAFECPEGSTCSWEVQKNKKLVIKQDGIGAYYPSVEEGENMVVKFEYFKAGPPGTADGNYSESLFFEVPANFKEIIKENESLEEVSLLFGRHCFCPDSGFFPVKKGSLSVSKSGDDLDIELNFHVNEVPQVISELKGRAVIKE